MNGLNSSSAIFFGRPHWCSFSSGTDDDHRTAGIVDALAEQVLAEAALLALQHVGQRLQRPLVGAGDDAAAAAVVEQRVDRLLQHALLVAHDDVRRAQLDQPLQAVVAVDDAAVEIVQVGGGEAAAVERHQRAQLRRDHRDRPPGSSTPAARRIRRRPRPASGASPASCAWPPRSSPSGRRAAVALLCSRSIACSMLADRLGADADA